jgi:hypothetical protein
MVKMFDTKSLEPNTQVDPGGVIFDIIVKHFGYGTLNLRRGKLTLQALLDRLNPKP